jgi:hypothetical protein
VIRRLLLMSLVAAVLAACAGQTTNAPNAAATATTAAETPHPAWTKAMADACNDASLLVGPYGTSGLRDPSKIAGSVEDARRYIVQGFTTPNLKRLASERAVLVPAAVSQAVWDEAIAGLTAADASFSQPMTPTQFTTAMDQLAQATDPLASQCVAVRAWVAANVPQ